MSRTQAASVAVRGVAERKRTASQGGGSIASGISLGPNNTAVNGAPVHSGEPRSISASATSTTPSLVAAVVVAFLPWTNRSWFSALLHIAAVLLISQAWLGHAAEGGTGLYGDIMVTVYSIHVIAAAAWVGGLPPLLFALVEQRLFGPNEAREWSVDILLRYSLMGMVAVTLIVASGIANAGFRVAGSFDKLFDTSYGNVLFTKIGIVILLLALAYFNRFIALPRLRVASLKGMAQINRLRYSVAFEIVLGLAVLGVAAILGITPPPQ